MHGLHMISCYYNMHSIGHWYLIYLEYGNIEIFTCCLNASICSSVKGLIEK